MRYEVFTLGKHYLQISTNKGFTLFANAKLDTNGNVVSYTDKMVRRGGTWVIDTWKFLTVKYFPENPIYCAVFGFADDDNEVQVTATDIDVDSISGVNGQLVDIGNISLPEGQALPIREAFALRNEFIKVEKIDNVWNIPDLTGFSVIESCGYFSWDSRGHTTSHNTKQCVFNFDSKKYVSLNPSTNQANVAELAKIALDSSGFSFITGRQGDSNVPSYAYTLDEVFGDYGDISAKFVLTNGVDSYTLLFVK